MFKFEDAHRHLLLQIREISIKEGVRKLSFEFIGQRLDTSVERLITAFGTEAGMIEKLLENERDSFKNIFNENNFEDINAIEILMIVSHEMSKRFFELTPSVTHDLKTLYPDEYQSHLEQRIEFVTGKLKINIEKGIRQGIYREDLSIELLARLYTSRLLDLHNPDFFPPQKFSFDVLYDVMVDNFIHGIANDKGQQHYRKLRETYKIG